MAKTWLEWFMECFEDRMTFVKKNCLQRVEGLALLTAHLDALAGYIYGQDESNYARFRSLLQEYSSDPENWSKISLLVLYDNLTGENKPALRAIGDRIYERYRIGKYSKRYNADCPLDSLQESQGASSEFAKIVQKCEYAALLWRRRNEAVHESLDANQPFPNPFGGSGTTLTPYYDTSIVDCRQVVKFILPNLYIMKTLENCLARFRDACECGKLDFDAMRASRRKMGFVTLPRS
jgi:hypothetical protein